MLQVVPEPGRPLCGFCSWLSLSAFAHYCGWLSQLPGIFCGMTLRSQALAPGSRMERSKMAEIGFKQDRLHALHVPRIALKTRLTVVAATALVAICAHIAVPLGFTPVPVTMQTFAVLLLGLLFTPGSGLCMPGALPGGRRRWPAGFQPSWSRRDSATAWPYGWVPAFLPLCRGFDESALSPWPSFVPDRAHGRRAGQHGHSCCGRHLARAAHPLEVFCCFRSVGRTVPPRRCRQDPRRDGLRKHIGIVRQRFPRPGSLRSLCRGLSERTL